MMLIKADGSKPQKIEPKNGREFTLKELQDYVGGRIQIIGLPSGMAMAMNEEGKLIGLPKNEVASNIFRREFPKSKYPYNNDGLVVGDALLGEGYELE